MGFMHLRVDKDILHYEMKNVILYWVTLYECSKYLICIIE